MARKKYGIDGLMEYQGCFHAGKTEINVHFKGGMLTAYGVTPATFSTDNKLIQFVIENSREFKGGRIKLIEADYSEEEILAEREAARKQAEAAAQKQAEALAKQQAAAEAAAKAQQQSEPSEGRSVMKFSDWGEARQWLLDQGVAASELTGNKKISAKAEQLGYRLEVE